MENTASHRNPARNAQAGIVITGLALLLLLTFGAQRQLIAQGFVSATAGNSVETQLFDLTGQRSPSVEVITQLQYTQQALFKTELLDAAGQVISQVSQDFDSRNATSAKKLSIDSWPNPDQIKVRLSVASQSVTAALPTGTAAADVPVIFEVNVYRRWLNRSYLWPGLVACIGLWIIVNMAKKKSNAWR